MTKKEIKDLLKLNGYHKNTVSMGTKTIILHKKPNQEIYLKLKGFKLKYKQNELKSLLDKMGYKDGYIIRGRIITIYEPPTLEFMLATKGYEVIVMSKEEDDKRKRANRKT